MGERLQRAHVALEALAETDQLGEAGKATAIAAQRSAMGRQQAEVERLGEELDRAKERDRLQAERPEGCFCLGLGGTGLLILVRDRPIWQRFCGCPDGVRLLADADVAEAEQAAEDRAAAEAERREREERERRERVVRACLPPRVASFTFDTFPHGTEKAEAVLRLRGFGCGQKQRGVLVWGDFGRGKTSLAISALHAWIDAGGNGLFCTVADWLDWLRPDSQALRPAGLGDPLARAMQTGLLVFDDLGAEKATPWAQEQIFKAINHRYEQRRPTVFTSNYSPAEILRRLAGDGDLRGGERIIARIGETCDLIELRGRNLRAAQIEEPAAAARR